MLFLSQKVQPMYISDLCVSLFIVYFICISSFFQEGHRSQPYTYDSKVKNFIQWIKTKTDSGVKNAVIGGYYPYPPVPETFPKYSRFIKGNAIIPSSSI